MQPLATTRLYYAQGSSNKEYHAEIVEVAGGNLVNFRFGRRGSTLTVGTKTSTPVDLAHAPNIYDSLIQQKLAKGYTPHGSGIPYQGTKHAGLKTGFIPQLLNPLSEPEALRLLDDDHWSAQQKMDGERRAAHALAGSVTGINRKGFAVPLPQPIADELQSLATQCGEILVDGEIVGDILWVFDLHIHNGKRIDALPWLGRMILAESALAGCQNIRVIPVAVTTNEKQCLWHQIKSAHGEGVVFKLSSGPVREGRPNSGGDWLKFKFTASASCCVMAINPDRRSVRVGLLESSPDATTGPTLIPVGNVSIPPNRCVPVAGDIIEVEYLYAYPGGSLYQPVYQGKRTDLAIDACTTAQLKLKPEVGDNDQ